jgi:hypothetical protein
MKDFLCLLYLSGIIFLSRFYFVECATRMVATFRIPPGTPKIVVAILEHHRRRVMDILLDKLNPIEITESDIKSVRFLKDRTIDIQWNTETKIITLTYSYLTEILQTLMTEHIKNDVVTRLSVRTLDNHRNIVGVYAIRNIPEGIYPFKTLLGHCFAEDPIIEIPKDSPDIQDIRAFLDEFFLGDTTYPLPVLGPNSINVAYFLNHSDTPNVKIVTTPECTYSIYQTSRAIQCGEELTINYNDFASKKFPFQRIQKQLDPNKTYLTSCPVATTSRKRQHLSN